MRDNNYKEASVPLPRCRGLVSRKLAKQKGKWKLERYYLPNDIKEPNFGLIYNFLPDNYVLEYSTPQNPKEQEDFHKALNSNKFKWLKLILNYQPSEKRVSKIFLPNFYHVKEVTATTTQPLIIGLGESSPYETGITLDFLTGLPIIPGSALKGITRRAAIMSLTGKQDILPYGEEFEKLAEAVERSHNDEKFRDFNKIFGTQDHKGEVIFMDAFPIEWSNAPDGKLFRLDVMNPHYGPYYESKGGQPPADWYNPVPVFYLTVNTGVKYRFVLASKDEELLKKVVEWLEFALQNIGVGAKGSQGYGVFEKIKGDQ